MALPKGFVPLDQLADVKGQKRLNGWLGSRTYCAGGCAPTPADKTVFEALSMAVGNDTSLPHIYRWFQHIASFTAAERAAWGAAAAAPAPAPAAKASKPAAKPAADDDDDDDDDDLDDMFGDSDEEKEAAWQAKIDAIAAEHNAKKEAKRIAKGKAKRRDVNSYIFDIKPYSIETDLEEMAKGIKAIESSGIKNFGVEHQLIPVAFGIKKLRIQVIAYGDDGEGNMFGEDELHDLFNELYEDDIQSIDTHSFTKM